MIRHMLFLFSAALLVVSPVCAQEYKLEPITSAPADLPAAYSALIQPQGYRIVGSKGAWCEIWFRKSIPAGAKPSDASVVLPFTQGSLLGIVRFPSQGADRRGQILKPGVYTLRYSNYPTDGAHQGVAPQRDFGLLTPIASDSDPNAAPNFDALVQQSIKGCGTSHPAVLSLESPAGTTFPSLNKEGETDWTLSVKAGDVPLAIIVVGKVEG
jgi:hypothetical protein